MSTHSRAIIGRSRRTRRDLVAAWAIVITALLLALLPSPTPAQSAAIQAMDVSLWPEYDRPEVLVMYRATLTETALPTTVSLRIPAEVGAPTAVAEAPAGGNLVNASYDRRVEGEWTVLTISATRPRLQVEYYDPRLARDGAERSFVYRWPGAGVEQLEVTVQEPVGARELQLDPPADRSGPGADGLTYHTLSLPPAEAATVRLQYTKDTDALSVESSPPATRDVPPTTAGAPRTGSTPAADEVPVWLVAAVGLLAVGGGLGWWFLWRRGGSVQPAPGAGTVDRRFCTRCGGRVGPEDKFCASCGQRLPG